MSKYEAQLENNLQKPTIDNKILLKANNFSQKSLANIALIIGEIEDESNGKSNSKIIKNWQRDNDAHLMAITSLLEQLSQAEAITIKQGNKHLQQHQIRGLLLVILFVLVGISGSILALKLFFILDRELTQKQQELRELNEQLQRFTSNASHQLRSPLAAILSNAQVGLLTPISESPKIYQKFHKIVELTKNNSILIDRLLFLARYEHQDSLENLEEIDLVEFLESIGNKYKSTAKDRNLNFQISLPNRTVISAIEPYLLEQVINNLLDNAYKYTPQQGDIKLQMLIDSQQALINIIDSGVGIAEEDLAHIFEYFYRVNSSQNSQNKGFGLGLTIAKEITRLHQGSLRVSSKLQEGTTFELLLPVLK